MIKLSAEAEPDIYRHDEDVWHDSRERGLRSNVAPDRSRRSTQDENTRASYPLTSINNIVPEGRAGHPRNIIMLTADAFVACCRGRALSVEQAMYHFLSGYTAKVAGTEKGIKEPEATFSTCFGAPFMVLHPGRLRGSTRQADGTS